MSGTTGYVLTIAGHDPSGGAGLFADARAILSAGCLPLSACTAVTYQTESSFLGYKSLNLDEICQQIRPLFKTYSIRAIKIGLFPRAYDLCEVLREVREQLPDVPVVWDPVLKTSTGYVFHDILSESELKSILSYCTVATPNREEVCVMAGIDSPERSARKLSSIAPILLKGGHDTGDFVLDKLFTEDYEEVFRAKRVPDAVMHGSGCTHSSILASYLARGHSLLDASRKAFEYMQQIFHTQSIAHEAPVEIPRRVYN